MPTILVSHGRRAGGNDRPVGNELGIVHWQDMHLGGHLDNSHHEQFPAERNPYTIGHLQGRAFTCQGIYMVKVLQDRAFTGLRSISPR